MVVVLLLAAGFGTSGAQEPPAPVKNIGWREAAIFVAGIGTLMLIDEPVFDAVQDNRAIGVEVGSVAKVHDVEPGVTQVFSRVSRQTGDAARIEDLYTYTDRRRRSSLHVFDRRRGGGAGSRDRDTDTDGHRNEYYCY